MFAVTAHMRRSPDVYSDGICPLVFSNICALGGSDWSLKAAEMRSKVSKRFYWKFHVWDKKYFEAAAVNFLKMICVFTALIYNWCQRRLEIGWQTLWNTFIRKIGRKCLRRNQILFSLQKFWATHFLTTACERKTPLLASRLSRELQQRVFVGF